jgi:hypothetical protein
MERTAQIDQQELHSLLTDVIASDPGYVTHPMSLWNKARRMLAKLEHGDDVSSARSWNPEIQEWVL